MEKGRTNQGLRLERQTSSFKQQKGIRVNHEYPENPRSHRYSNPIYFAPKVCVQ